MKPMNRSAKTEDKHEGLGERVAKKVGVQLEKMAVSTACWALIFFEPEMPQELIDEMAKNK